MNFWDSKCKFQKYLKDFVTVLYYSFINGFVSENVVNFVETTRIAHDKKLHNLGIYNKLEPCNPDKVIVNLSSKALSERLKFILAFGLDFGLPVFKLNFFKCFFSLESFIYKIKYFNYRRVVLMDRSDYLLKVYRILSDTSKFKVINDNVHITILHVEDKINKFLSKLKNSILLLLKFIIHFSFLDLPQVFCMAYQKPTNLIFQIDQFFLL